ncbi:MAG TPA: cytochrome c biogenesis protein CcdA [Patescibacteria group bacterium]|nr:cytochrome c biogenesis protein CcdA [Patescibacteria group bacterium]
MKKIFILFLGLALVLLAHTASMRVRAKEPLDATVFYNEACQDCAEYLRSTLLPVLKEAGYQVNAFDYINEPEKRKMLYQQNEQWSIPVEYQDSISAFVGDQVAIEGHVPKAYLKALFSQPLQERVLLYQPEMHGRATSVTLYTFNGAAKVLDSSELVVSALSSKSQSSAGKTKNYLLAVVGGGIANSLHPCAITVLLVLLSFLYMIRKNRVSILAMGLLYILGIFLVYFLIGLGLVRAVALFPDPFFIAKAASIIAVVLGVISLLEILIPRFPIHLRIPQVSKGFLQRVMEQVSLPSAFFLGILVGICAFPCTGGIYTVIITTLATTKSAAFLGYLLLYNTFYILPLLILVFLACNTRTVRFLELFRERHMKVSQWINAVVMIMFGVAMYVWLRGML